MKHISDTLRDLLGPGSPVSDGIAVDRCEYCGEVIPNPTSGECAWGCCGLPLGWESVEVVEP